MATVRSRTSSSVGQLLAGEDDDRHVAQRRLGLQLVEQLEAGHVGQPQIDDAAVERRRSSSAVERLGAGADRGDLDVVVIEQLDDAVALDVVVLDDQQPLACAARRRP